jgi:hypothetical protein
MAVSFSEATGAAVSPFVFAMLRKVAACGFRRAVSCDAFRSPIAVTPIVARRDTTRLGGVMLGTPMSRMIAIGDRIIGGITHGGSTSGASVA